MALSKRFGNIKPVGIDSTEEDTEDDEELQCRLFGTKTSRIKYSDPTNITFNVCRGDLVFSSDDDDKQNEEMDPSWMEEFQFILSKCKQTENVGAKRPLLCDKASCGGNRAPLDTLRNSIERYNLHKKELDEHVVPEKTGVQHGEPSTQCLGQGHKPQNSSAESVFNIKEKEDNTHHASNDREPLNFSAENSQARSASISHVSATKANGPLDDMQTDKEDIFFDKYRLQGLGSISAVQGEKCGREENTTTLDQQDNLKYSLAHRKIETEDDGMTDKTHFKPTKDTAQNDASKMLKDGNKISCQKSNKNTDKHVNSKKSTDIIDGGKVASKLQKMEKKLKVANNDQSVVTENLPAVDTKREPLAVSHNVEHPVIPAKHHKQEEIATVKQTDSIEKQKDEKSTAGKTAKKVEDLKATTDKLALNNCVSSSEQELHVVKNISSGTIQAAKNGKKSSLPKYKSEDFKKINKSFRICQASSFPLDELLPVKKRRISEGNGSKKSLTGERKRHPTDQSTSLTFSNPDDAQKPQSSVSASDTDKNRTRNIFYGTVYPNQANPSPSENFTKHGEGYTFQDILTTNAGQDCTVSHLVNNNLSNIMTAINSGNQPVLSYIQEALSKEVGSNIQALANKTRQQVKPASPKFMTDSSSFGFYKERNVTEERCYESDENNMPGEKSSEAQQSEELFHLFIKQCAGLVQTEEDNAKLMSLVKLLKSETGNNLTGTGFTPPDIAYMNETEASNESESVCTEPSPCSSVSNSLFEGRTILKGGVKPRHIPKTCVNKTGKDRPSDPRLHTKNQKSVKSVSIKLPPFVKEMWGEEKFGKIVALGERPVEIHRKPTKTMKTAKHLNSKSMKDLPAESIIRNSSSRKDFPIVISGTTDNTTKFKSSSTLHSEKICESHQHSKQLIVSDKSESSNNKQDRSTKHDHCKAKGTSKAKTLINKEESQRISLDDKIATCHFERFSPLNWKPIDPVSSAVQTIPVLISGSCKITTDSNKGLETNVCHDHRRSLIKIMPADRNIQVSDVHETKKEDPILLWSNRDVVDMELDSDCESCSVKSIDTSTQRKIVEMVKPDSQTMVSFDFKNKNSSDEKGKPLHKKSEDIRNVLDVTFSVKKQINSDESKKSDTLIDVSSTVGVKKKRDTSRCKVKSTLCKANDSVSAKPSDVKILNETMDFINPGSSNSSRNYRKRHSSTSSVDSKTSNSSSTSSKRRHKSSHSSQHADRKERSKSPSPKLHIRETQTDRKRHNTSHESNSGSHKKRCRERDLPETRRHSHGDTRKPSKTNSSKNAYIGNVMFHRNSRSPSFEAHTINSSSKYSCDPSLHTADKYDSHKVHPYLKTKVETGCTSRNSDIGISQENQESNSSSSIPIPLKKLTPQTKQKMASLEEDRLFLESFKRRLSGDKTSPESYMVSTSKCFKQSTSCENAQQLRDQIDCEKQIPVQAEREKKEEVQKVSYEGNVSARTVKLCGTRGLSYSDMLLLADLEHEDV